MKFKQLKIKSISWQKLTDYTVTQEKLSIELQQRLGLDVNLSIETADLNSWAISYWDNPVIYGFMREMFYIMGYVKTTKTDKPIFTVESEYRPSERKIIDLACWWQLTLDTNWDIYIDSVWDFVSLTLIPFYF